MLQRYGSQDLKHTNTGAHILTLNELSLKSKLPNFYGLHCSPTLLRQLPYFLLREIFDPKATACFLASHITRSMKNPFPSLSILLAKKEPSIMKDTKALLYKVEKIGLLRF